jgi:hypothetical protein
MPFHIHRPRQAVGLIYVLSYIFIFITFAILRSDDPSWLVDPKFTVMVFFWFIFSFTVKVTMFLNRAIELLNLGALMAFLSLGFVYIPHPGDFSAIERFSYYIIIIGGPLCDLCDFVYEAVAKRPGDAS